MSDQTANEVAIEYGLKLVERMAEQRDEARRAAAQTREQLRFLGALFAQTVYASPDHTVVIPESEEEFTLNIVPDEDATGFKVVAAKAAEVEEAADDDGAV